LSFAAIILNYKKASLTELGKGAVMTSTSTLQRGREAFQKQAWTEAYDLLNRTEQESSLQADDLECFAKAAYLIGNESESNEIWGRAHQEFLNEDNIPKAVYCAFWLAMNLFNQGEGAQGSGWMARANRLVEHCPECAEQGFLLVPQALQHIREGDGRGAHKLFSKAFQLGNRFGNPDLMALGQLGRGQALILQKKISEGTTLFDEAMVAVVNDEISPLVAGIVYCAVIETCQKIYDLSRAQEWTSALSRWCNAHPELVPYRGQCLVRRAEIMQLHGEWTDAITEVRRACELLSEPPGETAAGEAFYRWGELHRLQGNFSKAMEMYRQASKWGRKPQPGLALLRLMQGQPDVAKAAIRQLENEKKDPIARSRMLPAYIEIMIAVDELDDARQAADELSKIALEFQANYLDAVACYAQGSILLATEEIHAALEKLRESWTLFNEIEAVYESARARVLIGRTCQLLGDQDTANMEFEAAQNIFKQLGARPDLELLDAQTGHTTEAVHGLTPREQEVLQLLATGKTNKEIASELFISERTVDRHVSNILGKLNVPSRSAATAFAYEHNLI